MGAEALSKVLRRDIRRAYAPEASEEVLKFVDGVRQDIALEHATQHNVNNDVVGRLNGGNLQVGEVLLPTEGDLH